MPSSVCLVLPSLALRRAVFPLQRAQALLPALWGTRSRSLDSTYSLTPLPRRPLLRPMNQSPLTTNPHKRFLKLRSLAKKTPRLTPIPLHR